MALATKAYTLGKGKVFFKKLGESGERYFGNTTEFNITIESENLDHFDSDEGIRVKDDSVVLEITRSGSLITDNMSDENVALFFLADQSTITQTATPVVDEEIDDITLGYYYQLGVTTGNPQGVRGVTAVSVSVAPSTALTVDVDYELDAALGRIRILETSTVAEAGDDLLIDYTPVANTRQRIMTNNGASLEGSLRFIATNPKGPMRDYLIPKVTLRPTGDLALKGEDWQVANFAVEIGANEGQAAIYIDGRPV